MVVIIRCKNKSLPKIFFQNGLTHTSSGVGKKDNLVLQWTGPSSAQGHLQFR